MTTSDDSKITADNGNIIITNNSYYSESTEKANLTLNGIIKNKNGNVKIVNNGNSANLGYTVVQDGVAQIVGSISDQNGDKMRKNLILKQQFKPLVREKQFQTEQQKR